MPEGPVLKAWWHRMSRTLQGKKNPVLGRFILYPRCFSMGTEVKNYVSCTAVQEAGYTVDIDQSLDVQNEHTWPTATDRERSRSAEWEYLLGAKLMGEVHVGVHGKILAVAAGHHLAIFNFGLEASVMKVTAEDFQALAAQSQDIPGPNKNKTKAAKMRSFAVPDQYKTDGMNTKELRRLNIFVALECSDGNVWLFVDHVRLIRFHIISHKHPWTASDVGPDSLIWNHAFGAKYGPSWFWNPDAAQEGLDAFRTKALADRAAGGAVLATPLLDAVSDNMAIFNGFGKHTANDVLHDLGLFPVMPFGVLLADDSLYARFRSGLQVYAAQFCEKNFFHRVAGECNSINPFEFHITSDTNYISTYVRVYRRCEVRMDSECYNALVIAGLLDPEHTIGEPYVGVMEPTKLAWKFVSVWAYRCGKDVAYSVILAKPPASWKLGDWERTQVEQDIRAAGKKTTLGVAQFHQFNSNMPYSANTLEEKGQPGRRPTLHTGKPGRPRKAPKIDSLRAMAKRGKQVRYPKPPLDIGNQPADTIATSGECSGKRATRAQSQAKRVAEPENCLDSIKRHKSNV